MTLPDPVVRYVLEVKPHHEVLRRALIQLSGFLLRRTVGGRGGVADFGPVQAASAGLRGAAESLRSVRTPTAVAHHRLHLDAAASALERGLGAALSSTDPDGDALFHFLEQAERHIRAASRALPGFETVDFKQACCAMHRPTVAPARLQVGGQNY